MGFPCHAGPTRTRPVDAVVGRHDGLRVEPPAVDDPQPQLAFGQSVADAGEVGRELALEALLREGAGMAEQAQADAPIDDDRATRFRASRRAGERIGDGVADDPIRLELAAGTAGWQGGSKGQEPGGRINRTPPP